MKIREWDTLFYGEEQTGCFTLTAPLLDVHSALCQTSFFFCLFLVKNNKAVFPYYPYVPDFYACDFFPFSELEMNPKERHFENTEAIQTESQLFFDNVQTDFKGALQQ